MKALRLAAILMLAGGAAMVAPQAAQAQVNQLDAEINIIPDKVTNSVFFIISNFSNFKGSFCVRSRKSVSHRQR